MEAVSWTREKVYDKVCVIIGEVLQIQRDQIKPSSLLQNALSADSLNTLDLILHLEAEFQIEVPSDELFPGLSFADNPELVLRGRLTAKGLSKLRQRMPFADLSALEKNPTLTALHDLMTVEMVTGYICHKLGIAM